MDAILDLLELLLLILFIATIHCSFVMLHSDGLLRPTYIDLSESIVDSHGDTRIFIQISNVERSPPARNCFEVVRQQVQTPTLMPTLHRDLAAETVLGRNEYNDYNIYTARHTR
jgi:hypothetical protein